jgi:hypothetical protein
MVAICKAYDEASRDKFRKTKGKLGLREIRKKKTTKNNSVILLFSDAGNEKYRTCWKMLLRYCKILLRVIMLLGVVIIYFSFILVFFPYLKK